MSTDAVQVVVVALFALSSGALVLAWLRGRLAAAAIALFLVAALAWALVFAAVATGYRDADGFATCTDSCTAVHYVSAVGFLAPPLLVSLAAAGIVVVALGRRRARLKALHGGHS